ncbi:ribosome-inactivating family protein [Streptomyces capillispiralis]|uniref:ribosome-inactivating family protein n=1 Tax=Streptomyces capillispiralis TaxID=68182 RepID=UPI0036A4228F
MLLITAVRRAGRRLTALCLALLATCALVNADATPAHADTTNPWTVIEWDITGMRGASASANASSRYRAMITRLRDISSHQIVNEVRDSMPAGTGRYIEVRVRDRGESNQYRLSLYFRADNLYLDGFTVVGQNYRFSDAPAALVTGFTRHYNNQGNMLFRSLPYTGHYSDLATDQTRADARYSPSSLQSYLNAVSQLTPGNWYERAPELAFIINATSEAARFGWIENRIARSIGAGSDYDGQNYVSHLGPFGVDLQRNWARLSRLVHRSINNTLTPGDAVTVNNRRYANLEEMRYGTTGRPSLMPFLALSGA